MTIEREWRLRPELPVPSELQTLGGGSPLISQLLVRRGLQTSPAAQAFLDPNSYTPASPYSLPGMHRAVDRIEKAVHSSERICVWGDFDVDGQTATALLVSALRSLGADVRYHIPVRSQESHGVSLPALQAQMDAGFDLLLTCDTGIAANDAVQAAAQSGIDTVITDHHALPSPLPNAHAIVNPRLLDDPDHPLAALPGVGVAYKLVEALYDRFNKSQGCMDFLDLVALGIVADVATLVKDTRYLLQLGLRQLQSPSRAGLLALLEISGPQSGAITEETISFVFAPRLNAVGRLSDANPMVEFLTTTDLGAARLQAQVIESLNLQRKLLTDQVFKAAISLIERDPALLDSSVLVLSYPTWPAGVIGIIASRLVEYYHRPVVLLSSPPGEIARGSARSILGVDITQAIASQAGILVGFGGHPMAAGLSIQPDQIPEFRQGLSHAIDLQMAAVGRSSAELENVLLLDADLPLSALTEEMVAQLERLSPFGPGNPAPVFAARNLMIQSHKAIGRNDEHLLVHLMDEQKNPHDIIYWQAGALLTASAIQLPETPIDLAYSVHSQDYRGQPSIQLEWIESRLVPQPEVSLQSRSPVRECIDYRHAQSPLDVLQGLISQPGVQIWSEGPAVPQVAGVDRNHLESSSSLVILTIPPGRSELDLALAQVNSSTIYFFGLHPGLDQPASFLAYLAGLVKYALRSPGQPVALPSLAAALAHRVSTVRLGLAWLEGKGVILVSQISESHVLLQPGQGKSSPDLISLETDLQQSLKETAAFRAFYLRSDLNTLL